MVRRDRGSGGRGPELELACQLGAGADLVESSGAPANLPSGAPDPGMIVGRHATAKEALPEFIKAIARHRHFERAMDPPPV